MTAQPSAIPQEMSAPPIAAPRLWLPLSLLILYWAWFILSFNIEMSMFKRFMSQMALFLLVAIVFLVWWLANKRIAGRDRIVAVAAAIAAAALIPFISDKSLGGRYFVITALPYIFTLWVLWLAFARRASHRRWMAGLIVMLFIPTAASAFLRMEGVHGNALPDFHARWSPTPEERYLAQRRNPTTAPTTQPTSITLRPGDWPGFRGANRDAVVHGISIETDWNKNPPQQIWRRPIGPAWSSMAIVDGRVFTQEQRGDNEVVVALDAATGNDIWSVETAARFVEAQSAVGPRATPTFADGRLFSLGATGTLHCLDAATGRKIWSRDILADTNSNTPGWGTVSSPLLVNGLVVVASEGDKGLIAYHATSGQVAWTANAGTYSYSSPQLATIATQQQILFPIDKGLLSLDPPTGKILWEYPSQGMAARSLQPLVINSSQVLFNLGLDSPTDLLDVSKTGDAWAIKKIWTSKNLRPTFNDFVVHDGHIYGFDTVFFSCIELSTGNRKWKKGRYGTGQVLLLADQPALLVISDKGKLILLAANPNDLQELATYQAIEGKTWNHPALAHGRLYVRNAQEIACYELPRK